MNKINTYNREELTEAIFDEVKELLGNEGIYLGLTESDTNYTASEVVDRYVCGILDSFIETGDIKKVGEDDWGEEVYTIEENVDSFEELIKEAAYLIVDDYEFFFEEVAMAYVEARFGVSDSVRENFSFSEIVEFKEGDNEVITNGKDSPDTEYLDFGKDLVLLTNLYCREDTGGIMTVEEGIEYGLENGFDKEDLIRVSSKDLVEKISRDMQKSE